MTNLAESAGPRYPIRLLLVDDHPVVRAGLNSMLRKQIELRIVGSLEGGRQALEFLANEPADVMLLDLRMPNINGIDTLRALRKLPSPPKVVILSNFELDEEIYRAVEEGAMAYLPKNTPRDEIVTALKAVHGGSVYFPKRIEERLLERKQRRDTCEDGVENPRKVLERYWLTRVLKELFPNKWNASAILRVRGPRSSRLPCSPP
jgi:DNA-binding NarL/FixJ family response regulator